MVVAAGDSRLWTSIKLLATLKCPVCYWKRVLKVERKEGRPLSSEFLVQQKLPLDAVHVLMTHGSRLSWIAYRLGIMSSPWDCWPVRLGIVDAWEDGGNGFFRWDFWNAWMGGWLRSYEKKTSTIDDFNEAARAVKWVPAGRRYTSVGAIRR
jgi:hypothetical protein